MNREDLDEFFARAEDVLTDWHPGSDAMTARVADEGADLPTADSYYEQSPHACQEFVDALSHCCAVAGEAVERLRSALLEFGQSIRAVLPTSVTVVAPAGPDKAEGVMERALRLRRTRNTGPMNGVGLDGRRRRMKP